MYEVTMPIRLSQVDRDFMDFYAVIPMHQIMLRANLLQPDRHESFQLEGHSQDYYEAVLGEKFLINVRYRTD